MRVSTSEQERSIGMRHHTVQLESGESLWICTLDDISYTLKRFDANCSYTFLASCVQGEEKAFTRVPYDDVRFFTTVNSLVNPWFGSPHYSLFWLKREGKALTCARSKRHLMRVSWLSILSGVSSPTFGGNGHMGQEDKPSLQEEPNISPRERRSTVFHQIAVMGMRQCRLLPDTASRTATSKPIRKVHGWKTGV